MSDIKNYKSKELLWFIIGQIFTVIVFQTPEILNFNFTEWQIVMVKIITSTVFSSVIGVYSFVFDAMFSDELKYKILYFGMSRPGEIIFSKINDKHKDFRYTKENAMRKYKEIYDNMPVVKSDKKAYENDQWYQIYRKHSNEPMVYFSHRDYLLCRDIHFATIIIVAFYVLLTYLLSSVNLSWRLLLFELVLLIVSNIATRKRAERFVDNVIAYDLQEPPTYKMP